MIAATFTASTGGNGKVFSLDPYSVGFKSPNGLDLLAGQEYLSIREGSDPSLLLLTALIAHPMRRSTKLDHWVASTSRSLLGVKLCCFETDTAYALDPQTSLPAKYVDLDAIAIMVDLIESSAATVLKELHEINES
jgi:hypothetical protein